MPALPLLCLLLLFLLPNDNSFLEHFFARRKTATNVPSGNGGYFLFERRGTRAGKRSGFRARTKHNSGYIPNVGDAQPASEGQPKIKANEFRRICPEAHSVCSFALKVRKRGTCFRERRERGPQAGRDIGALSRGSGSGESSPSAEIEKSQGGILRAPGTGARRRESKNIGFFGRHPNNCNKKSCKATWRACKFLRSSWPEFSSYSVQDLAGQVGLL